MNTTSKLKKTTKTQTKQSSVRKETTRKNNEQITSRPSKQSTKKKQPEESANKNHRSPQIIKMMINQLEKQLAQKTKFSKTLNQGEFRSTTRKLGSPKNVQLGSKTLSSTLNGWRSPQKKKTKDTIIESNQKGSSKQLQKSIFQKGPIKKKKIIYSSIEPFDTSMDSKKVENKKQLNSIRPKQKKSKKQKGSNFVFLGDDLIKLDNIQIPLFIVQNSRADLQRSKRFSSRNQKYIEVDERSSYLNRSKISSINSVNTQKSIVQPVKFIQRSYVEGQSKISNQSDLAFLNNTNNFFNKNESKKITDSNVSTKKNIKSNDQIFDINQIIRLNNSVLKIQKWWKRLLQRRQIQKQLLNGNQIQNKSNLNIVPTVRAQQPLRQGVIISKGEQINLSQIEAEIQPVTLSQKTIQPANNENQYEDILKLRQTAAHIQFSTHQQILKQLLSKNKINLLQYNQKLAKIKQNLEKQLNDINNVKKILKQSAKKVEDMMKKTKDDILVVRKITAEQQNLSQSRLNKNQQVKNKQETKNIDILTTIFGKDQQKLIEKESSQKFEKKCKRLKVSTYQKDIEQFLNQSEDDENSFLSNENRKVFNSPNSGSQEYLTSPKSSNKSDSRNLDDLPECSENVSQEVFVKEISQVPVNSSINYTQSQGIVQPAMQTANFEQLYKQYQEQQQTKRQIDLRISKQLGVTDPQDLLLKSEETIGINTSIVGIHKFLLNFFKFYLYYHKNEFLNYMNMPYGESIQTRLAKNREINPQVALQNWTKNTLYTDDEQQIIYGLRYVIPESILQDFFQSYYEQTDVQFTQVEKANIQLEKIHNKAVFEAFNKALNFFRPYYNIGGAPYLWCSSEKSLTFYCIGEENIQQVYEKTQMKILKTSSYLCGPHIQVPHKNKVQYLKNSASKENQCEQINSPFKIMEIHQKSSASSQKIINDFEQFLFSYTENFNSAYFTNLQDRLKKKELAEAEEQNLEWFSNTFEENKVSALLNVTDLICEMIFGQESQILENIQKSRKKMFTDEQQISIR